jgi:hypothetical protein
MTFPSLKLESSMMGLCSFYPCSKCCCLPVVWGANTPTSLRP